MAQLNKVMLIGNLTRDPELKNLNNGTSVCDLGLATNRTWKTESGEEKEEVCFVTVVVWGKQAEAAAKYLTKGSPVFVEGRLKFESWEKNGEKRSVLKVHAERIQFLSSSKKRDDTTQDHPAETSQRAPDLENDDIPF